MTTIRSRGRDVAIDEAGQRLAHAVGLGAARDVILVEEDREQPGLFLPGGEPLVGGGLDPRRRDRPAAPAATRTSRTDSSGSSVAPSRSSKSDGLRSVRARPRASVTVTSIVTRRPGEDAESEPADFGARAD